MFTPTHVGTLFFLILKCLNRHDCVCVRKCLLVEFYRFFLSISYDTKFECIYGQVYKFKIFNTTHLHHHTHFADIAPCVMRNGISSQRDFINVLLVRLLLLGLHPKISILFVDIFGYIGMDHFIFGRSLSKMLICYPEFQMSL